MVMTADLYRVAATIAGQHLGGFMPRPYRIVGPVPHVLPLRAKAVYIAVDGGGVVRYVGSVCRPRRAAVRERTSEHLRQWFKRRNWSGVYVVPLRPETDNATVKEIEGRVGRRLSPCDNRRLPAPTRR
jgi:hypothetical protein